MSSLRDEVYENLDYLSQLTEVVISPENELLAKLPDRVELSVDDIIGNDGFNYYHYSGTYHITVSSILAPYAPSTSWREISNVINCFKFEISNDFSIDLTTKEMTGTVALIKQVNIIDDWTLLKAAVKAACGTLNYYPWSPKQIRAKTRTILNALEDKSGDNWFKTTNSKSRISCYNAIETSFSKIILENQWRIRNTKVISKLARWIQDYMSYGDEAALVNILKLKIMANRGVPVYSIEEVNSDDSQ